MEERIGLVDIGSNTIRLVIFNFNKESGINELLNIKTPARLSQYLTKEGSLLKMYKNELNYIRLLLIKQLKLSMKLKMKFDIKTRTRNYSHY